VPPGSAVRKGRDGNEHRHSACNDSQRPQTRVLFLVLLIPMPLTWSRYLTSLRPASFGIRQKMLVILLVVLTAALGGTTWLTVQQQRSELRRVTERHGQDTLRVVSQALAFSVISYDYHTIQLLLDEIVKSREIVYARVLSDKGNTMAEAGSAPADAELATFDADIVLDGRTVGRLAISINMHTIVAAVAAEQSSLLTREVLIVLLIALGEFVAISYLIVRPLTVISNAFERSVDEHGRIMHDIPLASNDEFGVLATQFNRMRAQLNDANNRLRDKVVLADKKLTSTNRKLVRRSKELKRINAELQRQATTDALTGLHNRRYFEQILETELGLAERFKDELSVVIMDVDHFKRINDQLGHKSGDYVLRDLGALLMKETRKVDVTCRFGGEEFLVLCRRTGKEASLIVAEKLRHAVAAATFRGIDGQPIAVTISLGVATIGRGVSVTQMEQYLNQADTALYASKSAGRNVSTHYSDMTPLRKEAQI
jgi:diguanylate cyclase (GGDEF)-like protein